MENQTTQPAEVIEQVKGTIGFSIKNPTPMFMNWIFRIQFCANKALMFWISGTSTLSAAQLKQWILTLGAIDLFVWTLGRSIGIKPPEDNK